MNDPNLKSYYNNEMTSHSFEHVAPYYLKDFEDGSQVDLIKVEDIKSIPDCGEIVLKLELLKKTNDVKVQTLVGVEYTFNVETKLMVKHEVYKVEVLNL